VSLKQKTITGITWSFIDIFAGQGVQFIVGIILARILTPQDFGLIGMLAIFIAVSQSFIDSGFRNALIRKQNCTDIEYSTVFYFNLFISVLFYIFLFAGAGLISEFFNEPILKILVRVLAIGLIFNAFGIIQNTILTKDIDFKKQTRVSIIASIISGSIAIYMAYNGYGVWSLVALTLMRYAINSFLLWLWTEWKPKLIFSKSAFIELFSFGSKLLISGLIDTIYRNIYYLIIGKYFTVDQLGYYTRADQFSQYPSQSLTGIIGRVSYPVLTTMQDDKSQLKAAYKKLIRSTMLITFTMMLLLAAVAKPLVLVLIGEKWLPSVIYLQLLCFGTMLYPLHALNLNMLNVQGRSDLFLKLEVIKKMLAVPVIIIGVYYGIIALIIGMIILSFIAYYINSYWSGKHIDYPITEQLKDIMPSFMLSLLISVIVFFTGSIISVSNIFKLIIQLFLGLLIFIGTVEITKMRDYLYIKDIIFEKFKIRNQAI
jgi:O-antigen/teichoic acid export membrane protein